jgi:hypothetical protein
VNSAEVQELLLEASAFDGRQVTDEVVEAWSRLLEDVRADQAVQAMRNHFATEDRRLMPVHIIQGVKKIRSELMGGYQGPGLAPELPASDPDNVMRYLAEGLALRTQAGDGKAPQMPQLMERVGQMPLGMRETTPMVVACPECRALVGRACRSRTGHSRVPHVGRVLDFEEWKKQQGRDTA